MSWFGETNANDQLVLRATGDFDPDTQHPIWMLYCLHCRSSYPTVACAAPRRHCPECQPHSAPPISVKTLVS